MNNPELQKEYLTKYDQVYKIKTITPFTVITEFLAISEDEARSVANSIKKAYPMNYTNIERLK